MDIDLLKGKIVLLVGQGWQMAHTMESWLYMRTENYLYEAKLKVGLRRQFWEE